jgi:hypothetical protein
VPAKRYALFPLMNYSGGAAPAAEVRAALETRLRERGLDLVDHPIGTREHRKARRVHRRQ